MDTTKKLPTADEAADPAPPRPDEHARAKAYLDLWERHLVRAAVDGPALWMPRRT